MRNNEGGEASSSTTKVGRGARGRRRGSTTKQPRPSNLVVLWTAVRPHTLTASLCPCFVAMAATVAGRRKDSSSTATTAADWDIACLWTLFCLCIQIGTNLHNDYADFVKGADENRVKVGQGLRATAAGWITPQQTCFLATTVLSLAFIIACSLLSVVVVAVSPSSSSSQLWNDGKLWFVFLSSIFNAFAYTGGPYPLGYLGLPPGFSIAYYGLGELFVVAYFGLVAVSMIPYFQSCRHNHNIDIDWTSISVHGLVVGLLCTNILVVNNLRDIKTDRTVGKRTTAVRFGRGFALVEYAVCGVLAYGLVCWEAVRLRSYWHLLPLVSLPLACKEAKAVMTKAGSALNPHVGGAAKVQLAFCVLLSVALYLSPP